LILVSTIGVETKINPITGSNEPALSTVEEETEATPRSKNNDLPNNSLDNDVPVTGFDTGFGDGDL
jgi:hypothetical protein